MGAGWFQRYGIPGTYFLVLTIFWSFSIYPICLSKDLLAPLIGAIAVSFLPIGYVISIVGLFWHLLRNRGVHAEALKNLGESKVKFTSRLRRMLPNGAELILDEPTLEAYSTLRILEESDVNIKKEQFNRDWISRRMDIVVINRSLIIATVSSFIVGHLLPWRCLGLAIELTGWSFVLLIALILVYWGTNNRLRNQIRIVITGHFKRWADEPSSSSPSPDRSPAP